MTYPWYYVISDLLLWNMIFVGLVNCVLTVSRKQLSLYYKTPVIYNGFFILFVILAVFAYHTGDFSHYQEIVETVYYRNAYLPLEPFYGYLINFTNGNYYLWRLIVWGVYFLILRKVLIIYKANSYLTLLLYSGLILPSAVEGRWVLGMVVLLCGYIQLMHKRFVCKIFALILLALSVQLHNSMLIILALIPFSLIIDIRKKYILIASCLLLPFFSKVLYMILIGQLGDILTIEGSEQLLNSYFGEEPGFSSKGAMILRLMCIGIIVAVFVIIFKRISRSQEISGLTRHLLTMTFLIIYSSAAISFSGIGAFELAWRLFVMAPYPLILLSGRSLKDNFIATRSFYFLVVAMFIWRNYNMLLQMFYFSFK